MENNKGGIKYISDIHLEFYDISKLSKILHKINADTDICVLAGDIGNPFHSIYEQFLIGMNEKFKHVILIHGNHEYYQSAKQIRKNIGKTIEETIEKTESIVSKLENVHFLNNSYVDITSDEEKYRFVGSTLWSKISDPFNLINDSDMITNYNIDMINSMFDENVKFIEETIENSENMKVIVVTHHLPSLKLINPKYLNSVMSDLNQNFASDCDVLVRDPIVCWIYGHTHEAIDLEINGIPLLANPIGYPGENAVVDFNKTITI